jgi:hypothetical protein
LVLEAQLNSSEDVSNKIGVVQVDIPKATLTGSFSIAMTPDGVASTPLSARALASSSLTTAACSNIPVLAKIIEVLDSANWYDNVIGLSIEGGDFALVHPATKLLSIWAIPETGSAFKPPVADLTFASSVDTKATVSAVGLVESLDATGDTTIKVSITAKTAVNANVICSVTT